MTHVLSNALHVVTQEAGIIQHEAALVVFDFVKDSILIGHNFKLSPPWRQ
jgi:hypothetical protein